MYGAMRSLTAASADLLPDAAPGARLEPSSTGRPSCSGRLLLQTPENRRNPERHTISGGLPSSQSQGTRLKATLIKPWWVERAPITKNSTTAFGNPRNSGKSQDTIPCVARDSHERKGSQKSHGFARGGSAEIAEIAQIGKTQQKWASEATPRQPAEIAEIAEILWPLDSQALVQPRGGGPQPTLRRPRCQNPRAGSPW